MAFDPLQRIHETMAQTVASAMYPRADFNTIREVIAELDKRGWIRVYMAKRQLPDVVNHIKALPTYAGGVGFSKLS